MDVGSRDFGLTEAIAKSLAPVAVYEVGMGLAIYEPGRLHP